MEGVQSEDLRDKRNGARGFPMLRFSLYSYESMSSEETMARERADPSPAVKK